MLSAVLLATSLFATLVSADLGKAVLYPEGLHDPLIALDNLKFPGGSYTGTTVPQSCISNGAGLGCNTATIQAVSVTYDDCPQPWTVCRCDNANLDLNTLLLRFGRLPPGLRSYVGNVLATYTANPNAYSSGGFMALNGDVDVSVFIHEASHDLDQGVSTSTAFTSAISSSSCVPDGYADTSAVEDFAQINVLHTYQKLVGALDRDASCLQPQLNVLNNNARLTDDLTATTCNSAVRPKTNSVISAAFLANSTTTTIVSAPESTMDAVKAFKQKYGSSRDAPAAAHANTTHTTQGKVAQPHYVYKEVPGSA